MNHYQKIEKRNLNLGIQILRVILSFWILLFHCLDNKKINYFLFFIAKTKLYHVPCFAFISFYYSCNTFNSKNIYKIKQRLQRLLIPYIIWPLAYFIINNIYYPDRKISFYDLSIQLLVGRQFYIPLWYLFSVIILTILYGIISILFINQFLFIILILSILSYIFQYSGLYNFLFCYKKNIVFSILGTLNILPLSAFGHNFGASRKIEYYETNRKKILFLSYLFTFFLFKYDIFVDLQGYKGIIHLFSSFFIFIGFYLLPLNNINPSIKRIIEQICRYTNGIYCLHTKTFFFLEKHFQLSGTFINCIIIYIFSYLISFIGIIIFGKYKIKYLFI